MRDVLKIISDDIEFNPVLGLNRYRDAILKMVKGSDPRFSIGIYGEWGTGKTTLMRLIEKELRNNMFEWDNIPGRDQDLLIGHLRNTLDIKWINDDIEIRKNAGKNVIYIGSKKDKHSVSFTQNDDRVVLTGNTVDTHYYQIERGKDYLNVYLEDFKKNNILTIWFNAWRYEREEHYALIALMKTIAYAMGEHPVYKDIKPILLKGIGIFTKGILHKLVTQYLITEKEFEEFEKNLTPKMELLAEVDKQTIYFDGLEKIEREMQRIHQKYPNTRVVVFIDDLDRCSPKTVLEVFESTKVFLGIKGFVYIIGLSHETISKLITAEYAKSGIKGEQYIRKIIQIPILIPEWNNTDVKQLIQRLLDDRQIDPGYSTVIKENDDLISTAVEENPREVKRFINNFMLSYEIYSSDERVKSNELLVVQALKVRWNTFFRYVSSDRRFRDILKTYINTTTQSAEERKKFFDWLEKRDLPSEYVDVINNLNKDPQFQDLLTFLVRWKDIVLNINWEIYRQVVESTSEIRASRDTDVGSNTIPVWNDISHGSGTA